MPGARRTARRCRSCGAPLRFVRTEAGRWLPVDARPSELNGNIIVRRGVATVLGGTELHRAREEGYDLYVSHFSTCTSGDQHRRDRRAADPRKRERQAARRMAQRAFDRAAKPRQESLL